MNYIQDIIVMLAVVRDNYFKIKYQKGSRFLN